MNYYSINKKSPPVSFRQAVLLGQAPDGGLYFPEKPTEVLRQMGGSSGLIKQMLELHPHEFATRFMHPYVAPDLSFEQLHRIISETLTFPLPLVNVTPHISILELFHGPTMAFKDVGARFMSRCLSHFVEKQERKVVVLVATSGDTGGAVAHGFSQATGVDVVILYPSGKVSRIQEQQMTTCEANIHALEVQGNFDDCQKLVKMAFSDAELCNKLFLTSANSINVARWLPQQLYYLMACRAWMNEHQQAPVWCVPSGNFGNIAALLLAVHNGMPALHSLAACNSNDTVPQYLAGKAFTPRPAIATLSNAMDVGNPSNFPRIQELYAVTQSNMSSQLGAQSYNDQQTLEAITTVNEQFGYLMDPHTAVGWLCLSTYLHKHSDAKGILLSTAHPSKFPDVYQKAFGWTPKLPDTWIDKTEVPKKSILMKPNYDALRTYLLRQA